MNNDQDWYYRKAGGDRLFEFGPFTRQKMLLMYMKGDIASDTDVRCGGSPWLPLRVCLVGSRFSLKIWMETAVYKIFYFFKSAFNGYSPRERRLWIVALSLIVVNIAVRIFIYTTPIQAGKESQQPYVPYRIDAPLSKTETPRANNSISAGTHPLQESLNNIEVLRLTNITRSENGVHELKESFLLNAIAEKKSK